MEYLCNEIQIYWKKQTLASVKEHLPKDSVHYGRTDKLDDPVVWIHEGDLAIDFLDLDWTDDMDEQEPLLVIINGNLTVNGNIINANTDGAISIMVFGDLQANHVAVGGQEIYVTGNINIVGVFCGTYNHGETLVKGDLKAHVLINDDYTFTIGGDANCAYIFEEGGIFEPEGIELLQQLFIEEAFYYDTCEEAMAFGGIVNILEQGKYPLKKEAIDKYSTAIAINPQDAAAYSKRGGIYNETGQYDQALADCTQAITIDPQCALAYKNRSIAYKNKGLNGLALADNAQAQVIIENMCSGKLGQYETYTKLFGVDAKDPAIIELLTLLDISRRPKLHDFCSYCLYKEDGPVTLEFDETASYEEYHGKARGTGRMVFEWLRLYSSKNKEGRAPYKGTLPCNLTMEEPIERFLEEFGTPDSNSEKYGIRRIHWKNLQGLDIALLLTDDDQYVKEVCISPVRIK